MSRMMNPGPPAPRTLVQARSGERPWPGEAGWRAQAPRQRDAEPRTATAREPTLVLEVDLALPLPDVAGGVVTRVWLLLRIGDVAVGELLVPVPENGLSPAGLGAAVAARIGERRRAARRASDGQARSRRRGSTSSL
jgi:hypothetical protein